MVITILIIACVLVVFFVVLSFKYNDKEACPECKNKLDWANRRYLATGEEIHYCRNKDYVEVWGTEYLDGTSWLIVKWSASHGIKPDKVRKVMEDLEASGCL